MALGCLGVLWVDPFLLPGDSRFEYRARLIQGTVDIGRRNEGGTRVACSFPA